MPYLCTLIWITLYHVLVCVCFYTRVLIINIFYLIPQYLIALPVSFVFDRNLVCIMLCIINLCLGRPCAFSQQNCNERVVLLPVASSVPTWGTEVTRQTPIVKSYPGFVTSLSCFPTRWARRRRVVADTHTVGVPLSHLSSLKAAHHWGNR